MINKSGQINTGSPGRLDRGSVKPRSHRWPVLTAYKEVSAMTSFETLYLMLMMLHIVVILLIEINRSK